LQEMTEEAFETNDILTSNTRNDMNAAH